MKTISIRELHSRTGHWLRLAGRNGGIRVTDRGRTIARIVPESGTELPFSALRNASPEFLKLYNAGKLGAGGRDVTEMISEDREDRSA